LLSILIGGFSPIFAYVLSLLDGRGGIAGWAWIFIVEGILTVLLSLVTLLFVPDFPHNAHSAALSSNGPRTHVFIRKTTFLTAEQTQLVLRRVEEDRGDSIPDEMTFASVLAAAGDWCVWVYALMFMCCTMPAYAIGYFITTILHGMGWNVTDTLLLVSPFLSGFMNFADIFLDTECTTICVRCTFRHKDLPTIS
jgi:hypothetical protein